MSDQQERAQFVAGLREMADFLEANEAAPLPYPDISAYESFGDRERAREVVRALAPCTKDVDDYHYNIVRQFGPVRFKVKFSRSKVFEKQIVTKEVEEWVCPDALLRPDESEQVPA